MTDFDQFERRLAAALRSVADERVTRLESSVIASAAIHGGQRRAARIPWYRFMTVATRLAAAALIATLAVGGAFYVLGPNEAAVGGPTATPSASPGPSQTSAVVQQGVPIWTATGTMIQARDWHTATLLPDGKVLVAGGGANRTELASAELYDPRTRSWTATGSMISARMGHTATLLLDGTVLVAGGGGCRVPDLDCTDLASAELFDPRTESWTATGNMIQARDYWHTATLLPDGKVLAAGGGANGTAELFDPRPGSWTATGSMGRTVINHAATLLPDGKVLVAGELFDPHTGSWTATGRVTGSDTSTLLPDGTVLVSGQSGSVHLYDPSTGAWTGAGPSPLDQYGLTATLLPDGTVLMAGGARPGRPDNSFVAVAGLYDPSSGAWTATASLVLARKFHTATLLPDGTVLVAGGSSDIVDGTGWIRTTSAELYGPGAGT